MDHQSKLNMVFNDALSEYLCDHLDATLQDIIYALEDAKTDAPFIRDKVLEEEARAIAAVSS